MASNTKFPLQIEDERLGLEVDSFVMPINACDRRTAGRLAWEVMGIAATDEQQVALVSFFERFCEEKNALDNSTALDTVSNKVVRTLNGGNSDTAVTEKWKVVIKTWTQLSNEQKSGEALTKRSKRNRNRFNLLAGSGGNEHSNRTFSAPQLPKTSNIESLAKALSISEKKTQLSENLKLTFDPTCQAGRAADSKRSLPLIVGLQDGMGVGKSFVLDKAPELFCHDEIQKDRPPLFLKITYNQRQLLEAERPFLLQSLLARLVLACDASNNPSDYSKIQEALKVEEAPAFDIDSVVEYINLAARDENRTIIIAVDEIGILTTEKTKLEDILVGLSRILVQLAAPSKEKLQAGSTEASASAPKRFCFALVTALPSADFGPSSDNLLTWLRPVPLSSKDALSLLHGELSCSQDSCAVALEEIVYYCGGHPRSLMAAADLMRKRLKDNVGLQPIRAPTPQEVSERCYWREDNGLTPSVLDKAVVESYENPPLSPDSLPDTSALKGLYYKGFLHKDKQMVIPSTLFFFAQIIGKESSTVVNPLRKIFETAPGQSSAKGLEFLQGWWDLFRNIHDLTLVPSLWPNKWCNDRLKNELESVKSAKYCFSLAGGKPDVKDDPVFQNGSVQITEINEHVYYRPTLVNHRDIESMWVIQNLLTAIKYLCLFQSKINDDVPTAVRGLIQAAKELEKGVWTKEHGKILFVIYALGHGGGGDILQDCPYPILLVNRERLSHYFTPSLAPAAQLHFLRHFSLV